MKTIVIYHSADFDGIFCREIARRALGSTAEYIGWDYGDPVPVIPSDAQVFMLDISIDQLMTHPGLVWIDHHKTAMDKWEHLNLQGVRIDGVAACRLAWQWFFEEPSIPEKQLFIERKVNEPYSVRLAGEYDVWDKRNPDAELFQHGLRSRDVNFFRLLNERSLGGDPKYVHEVLEGGKAVQYARELEYAAVITEQGFTMEFEGLTFLACNSHELDIRSHLFEAGIQPHHDALLGFTWNGVQQGWRCSLYGVPGKPDIDLSEIAKKYGGGGHKQACGFRCLSLPFQLTQPLPPVHSPETCAHRQFKANVDVSRLEDSGRFSADVRIMCADCGTPFRFLGLPCGLDLNGATVSADGEEARMAIGTAETVANIVDGVCPVGFTVRRES